MKSVNITINTIKDISAFCAAAQAVKGDVLVYKDKFIIDARSLMGLFSIDLSTGVTVEYPEDATEFDAICNQYAT